jgi:hypothetical protein
MAKTSDEINSLNAASWQFSLGLNRVLMVCAPACQVACPGLLFFTIS